MSALEEYAQKLESGEIVACEKIKKVYGRLLRDLKNPDEYYFDEAKANRPVEFIERFCKQSQGQMGAPIKLSLFQKAMIEAVFGFVDKSGNRRFNEVLCIMGRKNGKTTLLAALELYLAIADKEGSPEIYNIATKLEQAKKGFDEAWKMVQHSAALRSKVRKRQSDLYVSKNMGTIKALASNTNSLDGLNAHGVVIDELAAVKNRDIYDLMKQSMSARNQPLLFCITTNGFVRDNIFDDQYKYASAIIDGEKENRRFLPLVYELDSADEWDNEDAWIKANPGIDDIKSREFLRECVQKAKDDPSFKPTVMVKDFNIKQNAASAWLRWEELESGADGIIPSNFDYCIGGFDAADTTDLNAAVAIFKRHNDPNIYVKSMFWIPQNVIDQMGKTGSRRERDNVPYSLWVSQGYMRATQGGKVDKRVLLDWFCELRENEDIYPLFIGYDPWHIDDSLLREFKGLFGERAMQAVRQGVITLSQPMKDLKAEFCEHHIVYDNPVLKFCLVNTEEKTDINGNVQPVKNTDARKRIDGTVALLCAYRALLDHMSEYIDLNGEALDGAV